MITYKCWVFTNHDLRGRPSSEDDGGGGEIDRFVASLSGFAMTCGEEDMGGIMGGWG